jgi:hypothetical protein
VVTGLLRVVRPGGVVLAEAPGGHSEVYRDVRARFAELGGLDRLHPGVQDREELDDAFRSARASVRELPIVEDRQEVSLQEMIRPLERGLFSCTWPLEEDVRRRAARELRDWARRRFGPLDEPRAVTRRIAWRAYDLPV